MITLPWVAVLALAAGSLLCAVLAWQYQKKAQHYQAECSKNYGLGIQHQSERSNRQLEAEIRTAKESAYMAGWNACVDEAEARFSDNGTVTAA